MITFTSLASSSKGNAYLVSAPGVAPLLLEAGLPIRALRERLNFGLSGLAGCLVSHEHGDHSKAVKDLLKAGVECYMSLGTANALGVAMHHNIVLLNNPQSFRGKLIDGKWLVRSFRLEHDAAEPLGFMIGGYGDDRLLFIPDTAYVEYRFNGVTIIAIECNHVEDILSENIQRGSIPSVVGRRVRRSHMGLQVVVDMLMSNDLSKCRAIWLMHLSDSNSSEAIMKQKIQEATGVPTYICE